MEALTELEDFIKDEKNAAAFKDFIKTAGYETPDEIAGLKSKNLQVILSEKKLKEKISELEKVVDSIDLDEYNALKSKGKKDDNPDVTKLQREIKTLTENLNNLSEEKKTTDTKYQNSFKLTKLNEALDSNDFDVKHKELLLSAFQGKAVIENDGSSDLLVIDGGSLGQLPATEFFKKYAQTEIGKSYLKVPINTGFGNNRMTGSGNSKTMKRDDFYKLNPAAQSEFIKKEGGQVID